jgi:hypothetical protein
MLADLRLLNIAIAEKKKKSALVYHTHQTELLGVY